MTFHRFSFRFDKALQAAGYLLSLSDRRMGYVKLLKLLYIADRECLKSEGDTITGDRMSAMPKGPVLSTILSLIQKRDSQWKSWHRFIKCGEDGLVFLDKDTGVDDLYRYEKDIIKQVFDEHGNKNQHELVDLTHTFPEWKKYESRIKSKSDKNSYPISLEDILDGVGKPELVDRVSKNLASEKHYNDLLCHTD